MGQIWGNLSKASSTELVRDLQGIKQRLTLGPVQITTHRRNDFVIVPQERFEHWSNLADTSVERLDQKLTLVLDAVDTLVVILDRDMRIRRLNRAWREFFDLPPGEYRGRSIFELARTSTENYVFYRMKAVLQSGREDSFEMPSERRQGMMFRTVIRPWPEGVALFASDVTEKTRFTDQRLRNEGMDRALAHLPGVGTGAVDRDGRFIVCSRGLALMLGSDPASVASASIFTVLESGCREDVEQGLADRTDRTKVIPIRYLRMGKSFENADLAVTPYTSSRHHEATAIVLRDPALCAAESAAELEPDAG